jgi:serine protease inhibitor
VKRASVNPTGRNERKVALSMPRFRVEFGAEDASDSLRAMGLNEAFDGSNGFLAMSDGGATHVECS